MQFLDSDSHPIRNTVTNYPPEMVRTFVENIPKPLVFFCIEIVYLEYTWFMHCKNKKKHKSSLEMELRF